MWQISSQTDFVPRRILTDFVPNRFRPIFNRFRPIFDRFRPTQISSHFRQISSHFWQISSHFWQILSRITNSMGNYSMLYTKLSTNRYNLFGDSSFGAVTAIMYETWFFLKRLAYSLYGSVASLPSPSSNIEAWPYGTSLRFASLLHLGH